MSLSRSGVKVPSAVIGLLLGALAVAVLVSNTASKPCQATQHSNSVIKRKKLPVLAEHAYAAAVTANISNFKSQLLGKVWPSFDASAPIHAKGVQRFNPFNPYIQCPPSRPQVRYAKSDGDGGKLLCDLSVLDPPCVIYSLGSAGNFIFEEDVLNSTKCEVHTFDCTYDGRSLGPRHFYHKWCLGTAPEADGQGAGAIKVDAGMFRSWQNITSSLKHQYVDVLKMDIEGHEQSVLAELHHDHRLPQQISLEIHVPYNDSSLKYFPKPVASSQAHVALMFLHLAGLGYGVTAREDNPITSADTFNIGHRGCCSEFSFYRLQEAQQQR